MLMVQGTYVFLGLQDYESDNMLDEHVSNNPIH